MTGGSRNCVVGIVDYGAGNVRSIDNAFQCLGSRTVRVMAERDLEACSHLVLPGVGAFGYCAQRLGASGLTPCLQTWVVDDHRPLLGICVGMQLLADSSEESPDVPGLGWVGGTVRRIRATPGIRVPHVGWNLVEFERGWGGLPTESADFYFDHSYAYQDPRLGVAVGYCLHGTRLCAVIQRDNITASQFHPEKSQAAGMQFLGGFLRQ
jgi:glutamine amidotransferase